MAFAPFNVLWALKPTLDPQAGTAAPKPTPGDR